MANCPSDVVTVACSSPVALSLAVTVAPGTMAPEGSVTVPLIAPRKVCPRTEPPPNPKIAATKAVATSLRTDIWFSPQVQWHLPTQRASGEGNSIESRAAITHFCRRHRQDYSRRGRNPPAAELPVALKKHTYGVPRPRFQAAWQG